MRPQLLLGLLFTFCLPLAAQACTTCGNHGDTVQTFLAYASFMLVPFLLAGGVGVVIHRQIQTLGPGAMAEPGGDTPEDVSVNG